jgi:hypothetical protein
MPVAKFMDREYSGIANHSLQAKIRDREGDIGEVDGMEVGKESQDFSLVVRQKLRREPQPIVLASVFRPGMRKRACIKFKPRSIKENHIE